jgi:hypothetical protein
MCAAAEEKALDDRSPMIMPRALTVKNIADKAHGTIMGLTVVLIFPVGAMSWKVFDRAFSGRTLLWIHICLESLGFVLLLTGFGLGVWNAIVHAEVCFCPYYIINSYVVSCHYCLSL